MARAAKKIIPLAFLASLLVYQTVVHFHHHHHHQQHYNKIQAANHPTQKLLVNTSGCQIVDWPTIDVNVLPLYANMSKRSIVCEAKSLPGYVEIERFDLNGILVRNPLNMSVHCTARGVRRSLHSDDKIFFASPTTTLVCDVVAYFPAETAVRVDCTVEGTAVVAKVVPLVRRPTQAPSTQRRMQPNLLMLGIDSVSRLNFERHFPRTKRLITERGFHTLLGYNKVADNTFPNLTPLLTGLYVEDLCTNNTCNDAYFDSFPFVWKVRAAAVKLI
jgi:hypothetical protein